MYTCVTIICNNGLFNKVSGQRDSTTNSAESIAQCEPAERGVQSSDEDVITTDSSSVYTNSNASPEYTATSDQDSQAESCSIPKSMICLPTY